MSITSADTPSFVGSSILGESPPFPSSSRTGPGGADISLSELYISDRSEDASPTKPFSLLPHRQSQNTEEGLEINDEAVVDEDLEKDEEGNDDATITGKLRSSLNAARTREERLQHDLFVLKKLNLSFTMYNDALKDTMSTTENVALQLDRTDRLLDQYVNLLRQTEKNSRLIFDELWEGGGADQVLLGRLQAEAVQRAKREREEREFAVQLERERLEREEQDRKMKQEREVRERERGGSTVRGARGRGVQRGVLTVTRGRIPSTSTVRPHRGASDGASRGSITVRGVRKS